MVLKMLLLSCWVTQISTPAEDQAQDKQATNKPKQVQSIFLNLANRQSDALSLLYARLVTAMVMREKTFFNKIHK